MGRVREALEEAHAVLTQYPDDLHALKNLVIFHTGLGEEAEAQALTGLKTVITF